MPFEDWPNPIEEPIKPMDPEDPAFVLTCVGWHTQRRGNEDMGDVYREIYGILIRFMQDRGGLLVREILPDGAYVADEVCIRVGDLTPEGRKFMKTGYSRWLDKIDQGMEPTDTRILERALKKIRGDIAK